jgi:hypothetical protein
MRRYLLGTIQAAINVHPIGEHDSMPKMREFGHCRACGQYALLTWEHVPPRATPNKGTHVRLTLEQAAILRPDEKPRGEQQQGGIRGQAFCESCNKKFGQLYVPALLEWYKGGRFILSQINAKGYSGAQFAAPGVYPLRILKAVVAMFLAINPERFRFEPTGSALAQLLEDQHATGLPPDVRFYTYFNQAGALRFNPLSIILKGVKPDAKVDDIEVLQLSEITYPPFGFLMAIGPTKGIDPRLFDISYFADFGYEDRARIAANMPLLETHIGPLANDYQSEEEWRAAWSKDDPKTAG